MSSINTGEVGLDLCYSLSHLVTSIYLTRSESYCLAEYPERDFPAAKTDSVLPRAMTYLSNPRMFERGNAEGVYHFQPGVARGSALPRGNQAKDRLNPERVVKTRRSNGFTYSRTLSEFPRLCLRVSQGVALGWNLPTPSAFTQITSEVSSNISVLFQGETTC